MGAHFEQPPPHALTAARAIAVVGLGYGDEGKGSLIDYLVRTTGARWVARFNGGPQAAHHVVSPQGLSHCFAQLGSGTLVPRTRTVLSRFMYVEPLAMGVEGQALRDVGVWDAMTRLSIDPRCVVITPFHAILNRMQEIARGHDRHGSCGLGVGQALQDVLGGATLIRIGTLGCRKTMLRRLRQIQAAKVAAGESVLKRLPQSAKLHTLLADLKSTGLIPYLLDHYCAFRDHSGAELVDAGRCIRQQLAAGRQVLLEGAQGMLLDMDHGFWPHVTGSRTTSENAEQLTGAVRPLRLGVLRAYATRHGAGPFVTEDTNLAASVPEYHNREADWQGPMRVGWFDAVASRYALEASGGVDLLALTCLDRLTGLDSVRVCLEYEYVGSHRDDLNRFFHISQRDSRSFIHGIRVHHQTNPIKRGELTTLLRRCRPVYRELASWQQTPALSDGLVTLPEPLREFILLVQDHLQTPVDLVSLGPTAAHKVVPDLQPTVRRRSEG